MDYSLTRSEIVSTLEKIKREHIDILPIAIPPQMEGWLWICNGGTDTAELLEWVRAEYPAFSTIVAKRVPFPRGTLIYSSAYGFIMPEIKRVLAAEEVGHV